MIRMISPRDLDALLQDGCRDAEIPGGTAHLLDMRDATAFVSAHVPNARHVPQSQAMRWIPQWIEPHQLVVLIDEEGLRQGEARHVAGELAHQWFRRLRYLEGGMKAWAAAGLPSESGGAAGPSAASECGKATEFHRSEDVPWVTSENALPPDPARVKYDDASKTSGTP